MTASFHKVERVRPIHYSLISQGRWRGLGPYMTASFHKMERIRPIHDSLISYGGEI
jgi:hypothetical protein